MTSRTQWLTAVAAGVCIGVASTMTHDVLAQRERDRATGAPAAAGTTPSPDSLPVKDLQSFVWILERVRNEYVDPIDEQKLLENAVRGMLSNLDPHSSYLDASDFKDLSATTTGKFGGVGIEVQGQDGLIRVVSPIDDTPAARAGIQPGDMIFKIDDTSVRGLSLDDAIQKIKGEPGTKVTVNVLRQGADKPLVFSMVREEIKVISVRGRLLEPGMGYVRISTFAGPTGADVKRELAKLVSTNKGPLKGLVLDLRNNPGGVLPAAVEVSDTFIESGPVVSYRGRTTAEQRIYPSTPGDALNGAPIVVLVNGGSASAAEIVAGALQDSHRAVIMGTKTFGKGSVQTVLELPDHKSAIKLTTARYYTPSGKSIQAEGIVPDIELQPLKVTAADDDFAALREREADLKGRLDNPNARTPGATTGAVAAPTTTTAVVGPATTGVTDPTKLPLSSQNKPGSPKPEDEKVSADKDFALFEALTLLKGLVITRR